MTGKSQRVAEAATKLFAWAAKGLGLYAAYLQLIVDSTHPSAVALAFSGCLIAGAQTFEGIILHFIDNLFDPGSPEQRTEPSKITSAHKRKGAS